MRREEFHALAKVEREHWFYRGKRNIVHHWLNRLAPVRQDDLLVDIGAGTGQLLTEFLGSCRAVGVEYDWEALRLAGGNAAPIARGSLLDLPIRTDSAAVVTALDVLEHIDDDVRGMSELCRIVRPHGWVFLLVPAFQALWSDWDDSLGHKRRYTKSALLRVARTSPFRIHHCVYINSAAFLPILAYRAVRTRLSGSFGGRLEDSVPSRAVNSLLHSLFVVPACWAWFSPPFGVSLFCILQKRATS
jgi:SAM-dependent methyltransferase